MATTLETLDLRMKTLMEAWNTKSFGRNQQALAGAHRDTYPHQGERNEDWLVATFKDADGVEIRAGAYDNPENREIYDNFMAKYEAKPGANEIPGNIFHWFFKFVDIVGVSGKSLRRLYVAVFGNDTPNPTAQSAVAVSPNVFRQNDNNQKIELGDTIFRREGQDNEQDMYRRSKAILASSEDDEPDDVKTLYKAYFGDGAAATAQRTKGNNSPNGFRQDDTRTQFAANNQYDVTKGRYANILDQGLATVFSWVGLEGLADQFAESDAINKNLLNRWYTSGAGSRLQGGTALKGNDLLHTGFWDTLFPPAELRDANRNYTSDLVIDPLSEINKYLWGSDYMLRFYQAMGVRAGEASNSFVDPPTPTAVENQSKAGVNAGQIKPYDNAGTLIWNTESHVETTNPFQGLVDSVLEGFGFNATSSNSTLEDQLETAKRNLIGTFAPGFNRIPIPFRVRTNLDELLKLNLLLPDDLAAGRLGIAREEFQGIDNTTTFGQLYLNNSSAINQDENPAGSVAGIPVSELQAPAGQVPVPGSEDDKKRRGNFVYHFQDDLHHANTFTKQRGFEDNIAGNVLEEFVTTPGVNPTLKTNPASVKGVLPAVENDPDESFTESGNALADKTTLYKTLNKADTQYFPFMFETVNKSGQGLLHKEFKQYAYFQAAIQSISESYSPAWSSKHFFGRTEQVQSYTFTERTFDIQFIIFAPEIRRLQNVYERVTWLAQQTYASYDGGGRMKSGPIIRMTIGDMFSNLTGFIRSLSYDWNYLGPGGKWEISQGLRIPMACSVSMNFTVMHDDMPDRNYNLYPGPLLHPLGLISSRGANGGRVSDPLIPTKEGQALHAPELTDYSQLTMEQRGAGKSLADVNAENDRKRASDRKQPYIRQIQSNSSGRMISRTIGEGWEPETFDDVVY